MSTIRICVHCGATIQRTSNRGRWPKYCSIACRNITYYGRGTTTVIPKVRNCQGCDAVLPPPATHERNPRKWCSESCRTRTKRQTDAAYRRRLAARAAERHRATYVPVRYSLMCVVCGDQFETSRSKARYCSAKCKYRQNYLGRRARRHGADREPYTAIEIGDRDGWTCGLCTDTVDRSLAYPDPSSPSIDHVVPLSRGGSDRPDNVQIAHLLCNWQKGARAVA